MARTHINVLFTSVGRRIELVRAFRRAYSCLQLAGNIVATDIDPLAPALQIVDRPYLIPRYSDPCYVPTITEICEREDIHLVFPLIDPEIPVLAEQRALIEATGARLAVVSEAAAKICADKWLTYQFFRQLEIATPLSWLPDSDVMDSAQIEYPVFVKPRFGSAAKNAFRVDNARELDFFSQYVVQPIVQEYLPSSEITSDVICDVDGELLGIVSRQRIEVRWGEVAKGVTVYDPTIIEVCSRVAAALPGIGPITIQCMLKDGKAFFTEINPRFGGGVPLGITAGVDAPAWLLARASGMSISIPPLGQYQVGLYITRFDESYFLTQNDCEKMASCCFRPG